NTPVATATNTPVPATATSTATATNTAGPATPTFTATATTAPPTATNTPVATATNTPVPPTATRTPVATSVTVLAAALVKSQQGGTGTTAFSATQTASGQVSGRLFYANLSRGIVLANGSVTTLTVGPKTASGRT